MDRRSWPWKKKSSDKAAVEKTVATLEAAGASLASAGSKSKKDDYKKPNYVQISMESYSHLTGLEDKVKTYEEQVQTYEEQVQTYKEQVQSYEEQVQTYDEQIQTYDEKIQTLESEINELNEKQSAAETEMVAKENLVKQHAKVAEDAVSGWEKADAEALALKNHLDSVKLLKLTAEDRASQLDGALKECMRQIRNLKEEHDQKLHDVVLSKTKQLEKIKVEFESRLSNLDQELLMSTAENSALSRSLQERSNMVVKISEEKSRAEAEIEQLRSNLESCDREINSLKYELHISTKEQEIRNEEKNMCVRSAEVANKQYLEGAKKNAKLEAEVQRLRGLVRKKLPGPAALAQMKLEVENLGRDYGESGLRKSPVKPHSPSLSPLPEFSIDKFQKENEFLTERLLAMEEETKMLKEALAKRNSELQASRNVCAKTATKLQTLEAELLHNSTNKQRISVVAQNASNPPSLTSMSEDSNDDAASVTESWATTSISELSRNKKENLAKCNSTANANQLELMDDFLEMEKLACLSDVSNSVCSTKKISTLNQDASSDLKYDKETLPLMNLQSRFSVIFESITKESDAGKIPDHIKCILRDAHDTVHHHCETCVFEGLHCPSYACITAEKEITLSQDSKPAKEIAHNLNPELTAAISQIHDYLLCLSKESMVVHDPSPDCNELSGEIEEFSGTLKKVLSGEISLVDFVLGLSQVFSKVSEHGHRVLDYKNIVDDSISLDNCIDKVALPESKIVQKNSLEENQYNHISDSTSDTEIPNDGTLISGFTSYKCSSEEFEQLKSEKNSMATDLARCTENLESTKYRLKETEQLQEELKSQLASAHKSNSLADTQLKCMVESYRSLEVRAEELTLEVDILREKTESLEKELQREKENHRDALAECKDLQEQMHCSAADTDRKTKEERELAAAAEKLAECQETILLLGRQLNAMRPQSDRMGSPSSERSEKTECFVEEESTNSSMILQDFDHMHRPGGESPIDVYNNSTYSPSDSEPNIFSRSPIKSKVSKHRHTKSGSSSSSFNPTPEKQSRAFSRFFSSKGKIDY